MLNIGPEAGEEGKKKRGKNSNLPNTFDDDCSIRLFYRLLLQGFFFSVFKSLANWPSSYAKDKGFFLEGQTFLTKVKRVGEICRGITS